MWQHSILLSQRWDMDKFSEDKQKGDLLLQKALAFFLGQESVPTTIRQNYSIVYHYGSVSTYQMA